MAQHLIINLGTNEDKLALKFLIRQTPVARRWVERMQNRISWPLDNTKRFYGFNSLEHEKNITEQDMKCCINTINSYQPIIDRSFDWTQDCLNYLHNIFERYHGLLDQQNTDYWNGAPLSVRRALAELNVLVHRCENFSRGHRTKFICTWYGMPKTKHLSSTLQQQYGELNWKFGTVYLQYVEIGKTVEDLFDDQDEYIGGDAFKPFDLYSADFRVNFFDADISEKIPAINKYIEENLNFFAARGIENVYNVRAMPYKFPVADVIWNGTRDDLLEQIRQRQNIISIELE